MAKRFTDTGKWEDPWFTDLPSEHKLLWIYILDKCDQAGIWKVNKRLAEFCLGMPLDLDAFLTAAGDRISVHRDRWLINKFITFQYGDLTEKNKMYGSVMSCFESAGLKKGDKCPIEGAKDKDKDKEKVKEVLFGKHENLFFGDVPRDLVDLAKILDPSDTASHWHDYVKSKIEALGYVVRKEVPCPISDDRDGRIDLVASRGGIDVGIELDYRTPRQKSILKVKNYVCGMVLLRDPKIIAINENVATKFESFWTTYPLRDGKKIEKQATKQLFLKLSESDQDLALVAARNYANSGRMPKDPKRFLQADFWRDWIEPPTAGGFRTDRKPGASPAAVRKDPELYECFVCKARVPEADRRSHMEAHDKDRFKAGPIRLEIGGAA